MKIFHKLEGNIVTARGPDKTSVMRRAMKELGGIKLVEIIH